MQPFSNYRLAGWRGCLPAGDRCTLEVINDGPSILVADRQRIFERFTRLDDSRTQDHGGAGLGLAIVNEIVHAHHGTIQVLDPRTGSGARFVIELPRVHTNDEVITRA